MPLKLFRVVLAAAILLSTQPVMAAEGDLHKEIEILKAKIAEVDQLKAKVVDLERQLAEQKKAIVQQEGSVEQVRKSLIQPIPGEELFKYEPGEGLELPYGFKIQADATFVLQGTPDANAAPDGTHKSRCDASWSADIFIEKTFDDWGLALMHLEPGQGTALEGDLSLYSNVNRESNDTESNIPITELWYEHYLFNKQIAVTFGKMDPANYVDQNEYAFDEMTQFLCRMFRNSPAIEWPDDNTLGASIALVPEFLPYLGFSASYFNANNSYEEIFSKPFASAQVTFMPAKAFGYDENMWGGNYRVYWWYNGLDHAKLVASGESETEDNKERNYGFGLSFDQMVTDVFGVFARFGWERHDINIASANPNSAPLEAAWSCGLQMTGKYWKRDDDILAFAFGQAIPGKDYKDAGLGFIAPEGHFEAYYKIQLTKNLAISPDIQVVWNPRGVSESYQGHSNPVFVYGVRGQLDF